MNNTLGACLSLALAVGCATSPGGASGSYVEARTASVFAGACHYGSEYTTAGREAVLAWSFEEGAARGAQVVAVVSSGSNLAQESRDRRSVVFVNGPRSACEAAVEGLVEKGLLGGVLFIEEGAEVRVAGESYRVSAGEGVELSGELMADRSCCSMPSKVWYEPLAAGQRGVVGNSTVFRCEVPALDVSFECSGENDAFVGSFAW